MHNGSHTIRCFRFAISKNPNIHAIFFDDIEINFWLSNYYLLPMTDVMDRYIFPSANHYYQSCKFRQTSEACKKILNAKTSTEATLVAKKYKYEMINDWDKCRVGAMLVVVREKFTQSKKLQQMLVDTGSSYLLYFSSKRHWGIDSNVLGTILMTLRSGFQKTAKL